MSEKKNVFGDFLILPPCWAFDNAMEWITEGNEHLLSDEDWEALNSLANRCFDGLPHWGIEFKKLYEKHKKTR